MSEQRTDIYDREVERLTRNPADIEHSWGTMPNGLTPSPLFRFLTPSGTDMGKGEGDCGCPVLIKSGWRGFTESLTQAALNANIPESAGDIRPEHLPEFARLQRLADAELGREVRHA